MTQQTKTRDYHVLAIIKRQARGNTTAVTSKRLYRRHDKHKGAKQ